MIHKLIAGVAAAALAGVLAVIGCAEAGPEVRVLVDLKPGEPPQAIRQILPAGAEVRRVRPVDRTRNEYEVTVRARRQGLLEALLGSGRVERAEVVGE